MRNNCGVTITSVLVATALAGIVSAVVAQLITNQSKVMRTLSLREERENLLKHYRNTLVSGWDNTLASGCGALYDRDGNVAVPSGGLTVKSDDLYTSTSNADGWWKVTYECDDVSSSIYASDKYETVDGSGLHSETHRKVTLNIEFLKDKHPHISAKLAERKEQFYMHQEKRLSTDTDCSDEDNLTRTNALKTDIDQVPTSLWAGGVPSSFPLYKGDGVVIQYDFETNYTKCSQVPFVKQGSCPHDAAIIGFWGTSKKGSHYPYVYGEYVCSHDGNTGMPPVPPVGEYYHHPKTDTLASTPPQSTRRLITAYRGSGAGGNTNLHNFSRDGCHHNPTANQSTYVSYIDEKGTAYCQTTRHVVENSVACAVYPHPSVPTTSYNSSYQEPDGIVDAWGDTGNPLGNGTEEANYEANVRAAIAAAIARGHSPPGIPSGYFERKERDDGWVLGRGGFLEFLGFNDSRGDPGFLISKTENPDCSEPGYKKGSSPPGPPGTNGSRRGEKGDRGRAITPTATVSVDITPTVTTTRTCMSCSC